MNIIITTNRKNTFNENFRVNINEPIEVSFNLDEMDAQILPIDENTKVIQYIKAESVE